MPGVQHEMFREYLQLGTRRLLRLTMQRSHTHDDRCQKQDASGHGSATHGTKATAGGLLIATNCDPPDRYTVVAAAQRESLARKGIELEELHLSFYMRVVLCRYGSADLPCSPAKAPVPSLWPRGVTGSRMAVAVCVWNTRSIPCFPGTVIWEGHVIRVFWRLGFVPFCLASRYFWDL